MTMQLNTNQVHIWKAELDLPAAEIDQLTPLLVSAELEKALRFRFDKHRIRYIAARAHLRKILSLYLQIPPIEIPITYADNKKPFLANSNIRFNLSHSENVAVYALVNNHQVGVDVEFIRELYDEGVAARYFNALENAWLASLPLEKRVAAFYQIWSRKEAAIKATGEGFAIAAHEFSTLGKTDPVVVTLLNIELRLFPLEIHPNYAAAVAVDFTPDEITYCN
jgi:4'-phosphopantetheinyl transferase